MPSRLTLLLSLVLGSGLVGCQSSPVPNGTLAFSAPTEPVWTNGGFDVAIVATGFSPSEIELLVDGDHFQSLAPPFRGRVETSGWGEGQHALTGRAQGLQTQPLTIHVDRTPPRIVLRSPLPGAIDVPARDPVGVTFDEPVLLSDAGVFQLLASGTPVPVTPSLDLGGTLLLLRPGTVPDVPRPFQAEAGLPAGFVRDRAGNAGPASQWSWTVPFWLQLGHEVATTGSNGVAGYADLAVSRDGGLLVGVTERMSSGAQGVLSAWNGSLWEPVGEPVPSINGTSEIYALAVDAEGAPWIAFGSPDPAAEGLFLLTTMRWSGTSWTLQGTPFHPGGLQPFQMRLYLAPTGEMWLLATGLTLNPFQDWFAYRWSGSDWSQVGGARVNDAGGWENQGAIRVGASGEIFVATTERRVSSAGVHVHVLDGGVWFPVGGELDFNGDSASIEADLGMELDSDGHPFVLMDQHTFRGWDSFLWHHDGSEWRVVGDAPIGDAENGFVASGALILGSDGTPTVALQRDLGGDAGIIVREYRAGTWQQLGDVLRPPPGRGLAGMGGNNYIGYVRAVRDGAHRRVFLFLGCSAPLVCDPYVILENR